MQIAAIKQGRRHFYCLSHFKFTRQVLLIMKLTIFCFFICTLQLSARSHAQKVTLDLNKASLEQALSEIHRQTGIAAVYNDQLMSTSKPVTLKLRQVSVQQALNLLFKDQPLGWELIGNKLLSIKQKHMTPAPAAPPLPLFVTVEGRVTDEDGKPMAGATVTVKGTDRVVVTDRNGFFMLDVNNKNAVLAISFIGYEKKEILLNGQTSISVQLKLLQNDMKDIVVVGYGTTRKVNLTGSVNVVSSKDLSGKQAGQSSMLLQGLAPGVTITQASGKPGNDAGWIRIRGVGTLSSTTALILIDGVEGDLNSVDANDIESISILKDAASSAIYGSRAANGVILVTTKRAGRSKVSVTYNGFVGKQRPTDMPGLVDAITHMKLLNIANVNSGQSKTFTDEYIETYQNNLGTDLYPNTDWQKLTLTGSGLEYNNGIDVSAGGEYVRGRVSFNNFRQDGLIPNTGYKRTSIRSNIDITASDRVSFKVDLRGIDGFTYEPGEEAEQLFFLMNGRIPRIYGGVLSDGRYGVGNLGDNPIAGANASGYNNTRTYTGIANLQGNWTIAKGLDLNMLYAKQVVKGEGATFRKQYSTYNGDGSLAYINPSAANTLRRTNTTDHTETFRTLLTYSGRVKEHTYKLLAGYEQIEDYNESFSAYREKFLLENYPVLNNGSETNQKASGAGGTEYGLLSYFGRLNYDYKSRYLFEANVRYDGSSRFTTGNKFGTFPSFSAGWRISQEDFFSNVKSISNLKLRASWGQLGNQNIGNYPFATTVSMVQPYVFNNAPVSGAAVTQLGNSKISWETTEMLNLGVDVSFWNKLSMTFEYYIKNTRDILLELPIPGSVGLNAPTQNAGRVQNKGWDLDIAYSDRIGDFSYSVKGVLSDVKDRITDLAGTGPYISGYLIKQQGYSINSIYGFKSDGLFQSAAEIAGHAQQFGTVAPGDIRYVDINGDGRINDQDRTVLSGTFPRYTYSLNLNGQYKGFDIAVFLQGVGKKSTYLTGQGIWPFYTGGSITVDQLDYWTEANTTASLPRLTFNQSNNVQNSDFWIQNGAYLRVKNIQLGYSFPRKLLQRVHVNNLRLFISGQNVLTFDRFFKGFDVESNSGGIINYPVVKLYSTGISLNF